MIKETVFSIDFVIRLIFGCALTKHLAEKIPKQTYYIEFDEMFSKTEERTKKYEKSKC